MSTGVIKSLKCNCTREWGYCRRRRGISRREGGGKSRRKEDGLGDAWSKQYSSSKKGSGGAECPPLIKRTICCLYGIVTSWASSERKMRQTTREPVYPLKITFFFFYVPPLELSCTLVNSSHSCFPQQMLRVSRGRGGKNQKRFRICLAICPAHGKGHSENMPERGKSWLERASNQAGRGSREAGETWWLSFPERGSNQISGCYISNALIHADIQ